MVNDECYTIADLCRRWDVSAPTLHKWVKDGHLPAPASTPHKHRRWSRATISEWELNGYQPAVETWRTIIDGLMHVEDVLLRRRTHKKFGKLVDLAIRTSQEVLLDPGARLDLVRRVHAAVEEGANEDVQTLLDQLNGLSAEVTVDDLPIPRRGIAELLVRAIAVAEAAGTEFDEALAYDLAIAIGELLLPESPAQAAKQRVHAEMIREKISQLAATSSE